MQEINDQSADAEVACSYTFSHGSESNVYERKSKASDPTARKVMNKELRIFTWDVRQNRD